MSEQVADLLDAAADVLERSGWCQGRLASVDGQRCAVGALLSAERTGGYLWLKAEGALEKVVGTCIPDWNDTEGRTRQEVLDGFRLAAKQQRQETP